jgi:predicted metal-dependent peptidase
MTTIATKPATEILPFNLDEHIVDLLRDEPFFAALSRRMDKVASTRIPTAGVCLNKERCRFELVYNPIFMGSILARDRKFVKGILLHEFYHIVLLHVTSRLPSGKMSKKWNIATDLAINSDLSTFDHAETPTGWQLVTTMLPEEALFPTVGPFVEFPPGLSAEEYLTMLPECEGDDGGDDGGDDDGESEGEQSEGEGNSNGQAKGEEESDESDDGDGQGNKGESDEGEEGSEGSGDSDGPSSPSEGHGDHSDWGDSGGTDEKRKIAEERLKENIKEAFVDAQSKGFGSVSSGMRRQIKEAITPKVNWRAILRSFVKASQRADRTSTIKKLNRRYAYIHPGRKAKRQAKIAVSIDQSGSVSDQMLVIFYAELEKLAQLADFTIIPFDTEVAEEHVHIWKKGERHEKIRYRYGGTCFDAPSKWVNARQFDGHIVLTDMEAPKPVPSKSQRMWMTTKQCAQHPYFQTNERVIAIDD